MNKQVGFKIEKSLNFFITIRLRNQSIVNRDNQSRVSILLRCYTTFISHNLYWFQSEYQHIYKVKLSTSNIPFCMSYNINDFCNCLMMPLIFQKNDFCNFWPFCELLLIMSFKNFKFNHIRDAMAQMGEQRLRNLEVPSLNPAGSYKTNWK